MSTTAASGSKPELDILKFFAIILITNSHINHLYPIHNMGTGGSLGNTIFFLVSSIGLTLSLNKKNVPFGTWFYKRASRTYLITWFATIIFLLIGYYTIQLNFTDIFAQFIYPTGYWFIPAITLFYIPTYFIITNYSEKVFLYTSVFIMLVYFVTYFSVMDIHSWTVESKSLFKWIFYLEVMVLGVYVANNYEKYAYAGKMDILIFLLLTVFFFGFKFATTKYNVLMPLQFLLQLITIPWVIYFLKITRSQAIHQALTNWKYLSLTVIFISSITLEIYLLQSFFYNMDFVKRQIFPLNLILFSILLTLAAWALSKAFGLIYSKK
ncbi:MAG: acyltransferase family protein [Cytophaga sp.]|uniref:acyltransferase family protein n=1 Tax=Cytophaga sp. TaxID=29535 RepID=UPI003F7CEC22